VKKFNEHRKWHLPQPEEHEHEARAHSHAQWQFSVVVGLDQLSCSTLSPVNSGMGDCFWAGKLAHCITRHPGQLSLPPGSVNEYQLQLGRQRQVWLIPIAEERVGVQVNLWDPLRTRAIPERFWRGVQEEAIISSLCTFIFYLYCNLKFFLLPHGILWGEDSSCQSRWRHQYHYQSQCAAQSINHTFAQYKLMSTTVNNHEANEPRMTEDITQWSYLLSLIYTVHKNRVYHLWSLGKDRNARPLDWDI